MFCLMSAVELVGVKILFVHLKALEMRMRKLVLDLSVAQILPGKLTKCFYQKSLDSLIHCIMTYGFVFYDLLAVKKNTKTDFALMCNVFRPLTFQFLRAFLQLLLCILMVSACTKEPVNFLV